MRQFPSNWTMYFETSKPHLDTLLFAFHDLPFCFIFKYIETAVVKTTAYKLLIKKATAGIDELKEKKALHSLVDSPHSPEFKQPTLQLKSSRELKVFHAMLNIL